MFTVCPKCALTLVVTAADLRVAQGYVRCGRCSNVFNAIVGLSEDRSGGANAQPGTATTSIIRKAPSLSDDPPHEGVSPASETELVYAEPPAQSPATKASAPKPGPPKAPPPEPTFTDSVPDVALEFNADVSQVFIEAPPMKIDMRAITGSFQALQQPPPAASPPPAQRPAARQQAAAAPASPAPKRKDDELENLRAFAAQLGATGKQQPPRSEAPVRQPALRNGASDRRAASNGAANPSAAGTDVAQRRPAPAPTRSPAPLPISAPAPTRAAAATRVPAPTNVSVTAAAPPSGARRAVSEDTPVYRGSPDESAAARRAAVSAARRRLLAKQAAPAPTDEDEPTFYNGDEEFDAPPVDEATAFVAATARTPRRQLPRGQRLAWISGIAALGVVLVAQAIHHNRHDLATRASLNRPLTRFYAAIGVPLVPRWNPASYEVRQLGAFSSVGNKGNLTVRASLKNDADQPLPLPLLRITVQDRYGNRIATRDVPPSGYVPGALPADAHLGVGQRIDAEMSFKDPGRDAVGFEIDACLPTPEGGIACANDTAPVR